MALRIEFTFLKPTIWLLSCAFVAVAVFCLHYYQSQMDATRTLAMKLGLPNAVAIEDFLLARDSNQMSEVQLAAKVRPADTRLVAGVGEAPMYLLPLYATDADFRDSETGPYGFYFSTRSDDADSVAAFGLTEINALPDGVLVNVVGTRLSGQMALEGSAYAIAPGDLGLARDAFLVGNSLVERSIRLGGGDVTPFRDTLIVVGLFLVAMAAVSYVHGRRHLVLGASEPAPASASQSPKTPKAFQPLASQDEIRKTDQAERARRRRSKLSFATSFSGDPVAALKNPR